MCGNHHVKNPWNVANIPLRDKTTSVYYTLIHVQRNKTIYNPDKRFSHNWLSTVLTVFGVTYYGLPLFSIHLSKMDIRIQGCGRKYKSRQWYSALNTSLQIEIGVLFYPMKNTVSVFVLRLGNSTSPIECWQSYAALSPALPDDFLLPSPGPVSLWSDCSLGFTAEILPFEESKQYKPTWENGLKAFCNKKRHSGRCGSRRSQRVWNASWINDWIKKLSYMDKTSY